MDTQKTIDDSREKATLDWYNMGCNEKMLQLLGAQKVLSADDRSNKTLTAMDQKCGIDAWVESEDNNISYCYSVSYRMTKFTGCEHFSFRYLKLAESKEEEMFIKPTEVEKARVLLAHKKAEKPAWFIQAHWFGDENNPQFHSMSVVSWDDIFKFILEEEDRTNKFCPNLVGWLQPDVNDKKDAVKLIIDIKRLKEEQEYYSHLDLSVKIITAKDINNFNVFKPDLGMALAMCEI